MGQGKKPPPKAIALDPGGTTGIAVYTKRPEGQFALGYDWMFKFYQMDAHDHHAALWRLLATEEPNVVICERFQSRPNFSSGGNGTVNLDAAEYVGVVKLYCKLTEKELVMQTASTAKDFWTDKKIKDLGLWQPGQKHAMDALRHLLYFIMQRGDLSMVYRLRPTVGP